MNLRCIRIVGLICLLNSIVCTSGCATFKSPFGKRMPTATAADPATQVLCLWQPGEGNDPDGYPCRGFSGQILFLSSKAATPVKIDGEVRVYLFDDQGTIDEQTKPLRQFDFDSGSWNIHLVETSLGPTYTLFIPYVRRGVTEANCSLRVRLKPKQGPMIFSDFSNMSLNPTKKVRRGDDANPMEKEEVDQIGLDSLTSVLKRTTTIPISSDSTIKAESGVSAATKADENPIQQASHQVITEPAKANPDADRIRQLEMMVQQLMEQKAAPLSSVPPEMPSRDGPAQLERDELPTEPLGSRRRFQVRPDREAVSAAGSNRSSHLLDENEAASPRPVTRRASTRHPLDFNSEE